jgi:hypothetical protein
MPLTYDDLYRRSRAWKRAAKRYRKLFHLLTRALESNIVVKTKSKKSC